MKKIIILLLTFVICITLFACAFFLKKDTIQYSNNGSRLYYNGYTFNNCNNTNGRYIFDKSDKDWIKIATEPYGIFYLIGSTTVYYGNNQNNPDFIINSRTSDIYVNDSITLDFDTELKICKTNEKFSISKITTDNVLKYRSDRENQFTPICNFEVNFSKYPFIKKIINVLKYNDKYYMQDVWNSDYYEITTDFLNDIHRLGLVT